jgi:hypothetical protein
MSKFTTSLFLFLLLCELNAQSFTIPEGNTISLTPQDSIKNVKSFMITHSLSQSVVPLTSVSCNNLGVHYENSYYRVFDLSNEFGINGDWIVQNVEIGIGRAESGTGSPQTASLILYVMSQYKNKIIPDSLTMLVDTIDFLISDSETGTKKSIEISQFANVILGKSLVVEIFIPDGHPDGHSLFIGFNNEGETDSSYIKAPHCGVNLPVPMNDIMFPDMNLVMNVYGEYTDPNPQIIAFNIDGQLSETEIINDTGNGIYKVNVVMPAHVSLLALTPVIQIPAGFQITPASGEMVDFSNGSVIYNVNNNFTKISRDWTVTVRNAGPEIIALSVPNQVDETIIDTLNHTVIAYVPTGSNLTSISPVVTVYDDFVTNPGSGIPQDFSGGPVTYTVSHFTLPLTQDWQVSILEKEATDVSNLSKNKIRIYPNPTYNTLYVIGDKINFIQIVDVSGRSVFSSIVKGSIDLSGLDSGVYLVLVYTDNGMVSQKIIKQNP